MFVYWALCREEDVSGNLRLQHCLKEGELMFASLLLPLFSVGLSVHYCLPVLPHQSAGCMLSGREKKNTVTVLR